MNLKKLDDNLYSTIFVRKSTRKFSSEVITNDTLDKLQSFINEVVPLFPSEKVRFEIQHHKSNIMKIAAYSEKNKISLLNMAFMLQQIDLYIQSIGMGAFWNTTVKATKKELEELPYVICLIFGPAQNFLVHNKEDKIKRKKTEEITNNPKLAFVEAARLAPSSRNRQPYYLYCKNKCVDFYYKKGGILDKTLLKNLHWLDIGICICHVVIALQQELYLPVVNIKASDLTKDDLIYSVSLKY